MSLQRIAELEEALEEAIALNVILLNELVEVRKTR